MTEFQTKEKKLYDLNGCMINSSTTMKQMVAEAATYSKKRKWAKSAVVYGVLARMFPDNSNYALLAARQYRKGDCIEDSARWFLIVAELFAKQMHPVKAISALRIFEELRPQANVKHAQHIYDLCKECMGVGLSCLDYSPRKEKRPLEYLSFHNNELFSTFDKADFDLLFKELKQRKLRDGEVLARMGEEATCLYVVADGGIKTFVTSNGKQKYLGEVYSDQICGLIPYFSGGGRSVDLVANGVTEVLELPYSLLNMFKEKKSDFSTKVEALYEGHLLTRQLAMSEVFESENLETRRWVAAKMEPVHLPAGATLFKEGEVSQDLFLVRLGELNVSLSAKENECFKRAIVSGGFAGETAIVTRNKRTTTVRALTTCILMKLSADDYNIVYQKSKFLQMTLKKIRQAQACEAIKVIQSA